SLDAGFSSPSLVPNVNSSARDGCDAITPDGEELYFQSTREGSSYRLFVATRTDAGFTQPTAIPSLATFEASHPAIRADGLELFFGARVAARATTYGSSSARRGAIHGARRRACPRSIRRRRRTRRGSRTTGAGSISRACTTPLTRPPTSTSPPARAE